MAQPKTFTLQEAFGLPSQTQIQGFDEHPLAPPKKEYFFHRGMVSDMLAFFRSGERACYLYGERGTGKTSFAEQFHAHLNLPLVVVSGSSDMLTEKLLGSWVMKSDKSMEYRYAGILLAAKAGVPVLVDEYNLIPSGVISIVNRLLEGYYYDCPETGERIVPGPGFRLYATGNPADGVQYKDREEMDSAQEERFFWIECHYPSAAEETPMVERQLETAVTDPAIRSTLAQQMVDVANKIRDRHMARNQGSDALRTVMSTRTLLRWARYTCVFHEVTRMGKSPLHYALERVLTRAPSVDAGEKTAVHEIVTLVTGQQYEV
ncbi:AAA family ATPase [Crenobacter sp. SG2305]|uniref:AAA family ATPase n=1 Tax=Crenobacter oryzisoli TaxID=3056844 RepID=UPI0025AACBEC|nr:AAA family ATPase [Crenobacter sp. SG2305]MDN0082508.1 AAA family ATPase [Crenobacter sp. SG2305]